MNRFATCLSFFLLASALPLAAQAPAAETFSGSIDVRVVNVEAVVTDHRGQRVTGLTAKDFRLLIDGHETPIESFAEVGGGQSRPAASAGPAPPAAGTAEPAGAREGRSLVVFIDDSFAVKTHRDMVLKKLGEQLGRLEPSDRVAVVAFDGERLAVLSGWASGREALAAVVAKAQRRPAAGIAVTAKRRAAQEDALFLAQIEADINGDESSAAGPSLSTSRLYSQPLSSGVGDPILSRRLEKIPIAITATMRQFSRAPGRKLMLLLSGGWPSPAVVFQVAGEANRLGYTLYPVDVSGIDTTFAENDAALDGPTPPGLRRDSWEADSEYILELLARATGGKTSINGNRLEALPRTLEDTRSYYWLSFTPRWAGDDRSHGIKLEALRPGLTVRSRRSFADLSQATRTKLVSQELLFFGNDPERRQLGVKVGKPEKTDRDDRRVPVDLAIPVLAFAAGREGRAAAELVLSAQSLDDAGTRRMFPEAPVRVALDPASAPDGTAHFQITLPLRGRGQRLTFTLREAASGEVIWGEARVAL
ncbi:MAG TPA: VWA domain-containing protein [Thermoanaerobaculia bacterium]|nr:VWA domain-containing protein [Thermoanaerobaculia bacterium]